jgi:hypothetical protein
MENMESLFENLKKDILRELSKKINENPIEIIKNNSQKEKEKEIVLEGGKKVRKKRELVPKNYKDIFHYVNADGLLLGQYYNTSPGGAAKKIAKKIFRNTGKKKFDFKIYNKTKDKFYTYMANAKECNRMTNVCGFIYFIKSEIKITRM